MLKLLPPSTYHLPPTRRGQILVESILALGVLTMGFLGAFTLLSRSFILNRAVADEYVATYLAAEGVEVVKNIIDHNQILRVTSEPARAWDAGISDGAYEIQYDSTTLAVNQNRTLKFDPSTKLYSYSGPNNTTFRRTLNITKATDEIIVKSQVDWTGHGGSSRQTILEDHFYRWRP